jgi:protein TonB
MQNDLIRGSSRAGCAAGCVAVLAALRGPIVRAVAACVCAGLLQAAHAVELAPAKMLKAVVPNYPTNARRAAVEGAVHVRVRVLASGQPGEVRVQKSSGAAELDEAAVAAATRSTFRAAQDAAGTAVDSWVLVPYRFVLEDPPEPEATPLILSPSTPEAP